MSMIQSTGAAALRKRGGPAALAAVFLLQGGCAMALDKPEYEVVYEQDGVEYRRYAPYLVAETLIDTDSYSRAGNEGFRRLFRYISGGNQPGRKVAMTAPVEQTPAGRGEKISMTAPVEQAESAEGWRVSFMLPHGYSRDTAPRPADDRVRIREVDGGLRAALRFSGRWTDRNMAEHETELLDALAAAGVAPEGPVRAAMYNGPFVPPFLRRNEVLVPVAALPDAAPAEARAAVAAGG